MTLSYPSMVSRSTAFCVREPDLPDTFVLDVARLTFVGAFDVDEELEVPPLELKALVSLTL